MAGTAVHKGNLQIDGTLVLNGTLETNAAVNNDAAQDFDAGVDLVGASVATSHRELAADAALTLAATDHTIELNITTGTTAATMTATHAGHEVIVYAGIRSGGAYTLACTRGATSGTVTLDAAGEGCIVKYNGSAWKLVDLLGSATFA